MKRTDFRHFYRQQLKGPTSRALFARCGMRGSTPRAFEAQKDGQSSAASPTCREKRARYGSPHVPLVVTDRRAKYVYTFSCNLGLSPSSFEALT